MKAPTPTKVEPTSTLDVNEHKQKETFVDGDNDVIEDLSVDPVLEAAEKKDSPDKKKQGGSMLNAAPTKASMGGNADADGEHVSPIDGFLKDAFKIDESKGDSYTEESTDE